MTPLSRTRTLWSVFEIAGFMAVWLTCQWYIAPMMRDDAWLRIPLLAVLLVCGFYIAVVSPLLIHRDPASVRGLGSWRTGFVRTDNLREAFRAFGLLAIALTAILVVAALVRRPDLLQTLNWKALVTKFALYIAAALAQALIFFGFVFTRIRGIVDGAGGPDHDRHAVVSRRATVAMLTAALFSICHNPNLPLMALTFVAGALWAWLYYTRPNVLALAVSHAIVGTVLHRVVELHMRIGPFYSNPDYHPVRDVFPFVKPLIGNQF